MAALRPTARLVTMATKPLGTIFFVSSISTSSPLTSETETPSSPAISALMPTSLSTFPFTVNESKAKLWASTPGLPALAWAPVNMRVPKLLSIPVTITSGLGNPRTRIAELSSSQGSTLANRFPPWPSFTTKLRAPARRAPRMVAFTSRVSRRRKRSQ